MLTESERRLARIAVQKKYLTGTQLCVCIESRRASSLPLDRIFVEQGFLTPQEADELQSLSDDSPACAAPFGELLIQRGLASDTQVLDAYAVKTRLATQNIHRYLGEILVERRVISTDQVTELLAQQGKRVVECPGCGYRFNASHDQGYECPECGRRLDAPAPVPASPLLPLTLREEIGSGPNGTVFRAFHETLRQEVALKVLKVDRPPGDLVRRAVTVLHPNVARTLRIATWNGAPCIVSEFVEGIPLYDHVVGSVRLAPEDAIPILKQIAAGLGSAHLRGVAHGNLKARNVIVQDSREIKITDFGLAPSRADAYSADLHLYLPTERQRAEPTPTADLYACGVLWYFMLTGGQPFAAPSTDEIRRRHQEGRPIPPSARVRGLPRGFDAVFTKLTFREPLLRYRGAADLLEDLDRLENGDTAVAERELKKGTRRAQVQPADPGIRRRRPLRRRS
ncbi:MAG TPA: serine/threonine-protein kinase [Planctomycetota bacterium]|nr:serine/threonine-protein kinase [Planctomycetota bacterium]